MGCQGLVMVCILLAGGLNDGCGIGAAAAESGTPKPEFVRRVFVDRQQGERRYLVFRPRGFSRSDRRPLILFLNGFGENGEDGIRQISNNFGPDVWRMRDVFPFVVVAPQCRTGGSLYDLERGEGKLAMDMLAAVEQEYGTDPDRVYVTGPSSGGGAVWNIASVYPERFAAIAPLCARTGAQPHALVGANLPTWNFYNDGDLPGLVAYNRNLREELIRLGGSPLATEYHAPDHNCWGRAYSTAALYAWFLTHDRKKSRLEKGKYALIEPEQLLREWNLHGQADWRVEEGRVLACSIASEGQTGAAVQPVPLGDSELHVDARWSVDAAFRIGLFEPGDAERHSLMLAIPYPGSGFGGLTTREGETLALLDPVGQRQLDAEGWNDLRLTRRGDFLSLSINGWPGLTCRDPRLNREDYLFGLLAPVGSAAGAEGEMRWRYLRCRSLQAAEGEQAKSTVGRAAPDRPPGAAEPRESAVAENEQGGEVTVARASSTTGGEAVSPAARKPNLEGIAADWRKREATFSTAEIQWTIRGDELTRFGGWRRTPVRTENGVASSERLLVSGSDWRFDGWRSPKDSRRILEAHTAEDVFRSLLVSGNLPTDPAMKPVVPCVLWKTDERLTRLWNGTGEEAFHALVDAASPSELIPGTGTSNAADRMQDLLLEGILLTLRPLSQGPLTNASDQCRLIDDRLPIDETAHVVLERQFDSENRAANTHVRQYWLDPQKGYSVVRVIDLSNGSPQSQLDICYTPGATDDSVPSHWIAMIVDRSHNAPSFLYADRTAMTGDAPRRQERLQVDLPAGTRVVDRTQSQIFIIQADGTRVASNDVADRELHNRASSVSRSTLRTSLAAAVKWPGILLTLSCFVGVVWIVRRVAQSVRFPRGLPPQPTE